MWGIGRSKTDSLSVTAQRKSSKYNEGQIVFQPGDYPNLPKVIYKILQDGSILAAEFLVTDDNVLFVKNVMLTDEQIFTVAKDEIYVPYLTTNWKQHSETGQFIKDQKKYELDKIAQGEGLYRVECLFDNRETSNWYRITAATAQRLYDELKHARENRTTWELQTGSLEKQFIAGENIVQVTIKRMS